MKKQTTKCARKTNACLALLVLAMLAPMGAALGSTSGSSASSNATLSAFADGSVSKTLTFDAGADADSSVFVRLPHNATVADASLDATVSGSSAVSSGALVFDVGADGTADATASLSVLGTTRVALPAAAFDAYLKAQGEASGSIDVPVKVTGAASSAWSARLGGLAVNYAVEGSLLVAPRLKGEIGAVAVASGQVNRSAVDLAAYFEGQANETLTFSAQLAADAQAAALGLALEVNGSKVDIRSDNANWWGEVEVRFAAADAQGQVAFSNNVTVHVTPGPVTAPTTRTDVQVGAETIVVNECNWPAVVGTFAVPADAVVTDASMSIDGAVGVSALGATADVIAGVGATAGLNLSDLPTVVELNVTALNARIQGSASSWGLVTLDVALDVCPSGAAADVRVGNLSVTYTRGATNATATGQVFAGISLDGQVTGQVDSDTQLRLEAHTNGTLPADARVTWYIDGELIGSGSAIEGVTLCRGNHTVEARMATETTVQVYTSTVEAVSDAQAQAEIAIDGVVKTTVESGTALILALRTPEPMAANASVDWYIDGRFAGRGQVLANVTLEPGTHSVEARSNASGEVHSYAASVTASSAAATNNLLTVLLACAAVAGCLGVFYALARRR